MKHVCEEACEIQFPAFTTNLHVKPHLKTAHEKVCETASELLLPFTVKLYVKPHVKYM